MKENVLIIEDDPNILKAEQLILQKNFTVHTAVDGDEGLKKAKLVKPRLVILDVMIPKIDGFTVCRNIRLDANLRNTKIIMVTAKNEDRDEAKGMELGADDYIMKPFEPEELLHVVNQVLGIQ
ncbi:response regulator [Candidatus Woesearchaeota archaeon]|nr:response regulator [Candidatus Woesearchaeota archaeon]